MLFVVASMMLLLAWLLWHGLQRFGTRITTLLHEWLIRVRPHAQRLSFPGAVQDMWQMMSRLGVQVLLSMAVAVTACIGFVEIADQIGVDDDLGRFDSALSAALSQRRPTPLAG